ncbi:homoserine O-succinyltransferase MetA [Aliikangiella coralliicola]|uniref:homoserine O-succinyltransferase MetA n=1 Tax=Aliikangiella coralliicola TaxID=2592383 RepID=UPI001AEFA824|nr:homoserine O-succinyltransferase [Aliikangiella coralliicola]
MAFSKLPTFQRLMNEHHDVLPLEKATHQDIRELHVGLLNMMPDATLQATERQFMRLVGDCNQIVQFYVHPFTLPSIDRSSEAQQWIDDYYQDFESIKENGLDALIISGANPISDSLEQEAFWPMLTEVIDWAKDNVTSTLCACLATHAVVQYLYDIKRQPLPEKKWGVYQHKLTKIDHPLTRHTNTRFDVPHSRYNQITREQLDQQGVITLAESAEAGVHLATSSDGIRLVFFQGHPEYDDFSLLKEYKREIDRWLSGQRGDYPPFPQNYFNPVVEQRLIDYREQLKSSKSTDSEYPAWPEEWLMEHLDNTWRDTALSTFNNWLGLVYQLTNKNPKLPFMDGVDPENPLASL